MREELGLAASCAFSTATSGAPTCETELVETFLHVARGGAAARDRGEIDEGRWFTLAEAAALVARGAATPNLAEELRRLREIGLLARGEAGPC